VTQILAGLILAALAVFFAAASYGQLKGRLTGRPNAFAPKIGTRRTSFISSAIAFAWLAILFAGGALVSFMDL
jgi:hypothetical protein